MVCFAHEMWTAFLANSTIFLSSKLQRCFTSNMLCQIQQSSIYAGSSLLMDILIPASYRTRILGPSFAYVSCRMYDQGQIVMPTSRLRTRLIKFGSSAALSPWSIRSSPSPAMTEAACLICSCVFSKPTSQCIVSLKPSGRASEKTSSKSEGGRSL